VSEEKQSNPWAYDFDADHAHVMNTTGAEDQPQRDDTADDDKVPPSDEQVEEVTDEDNAG